MPWFRVTLAAGERRRTERIRARTLAEAREAYSHARIPGIRIVSVEPDCDPDSPTAIPTSPKPPSPLPKTNQHGTE